MQRTRARELVLFALYQSEFLPVSLEDVLEEEDPGDQRDYILAPSVASTIVATRSIA